MSFLAQLPQSAATQLQGLGVGNVSRTIQEWAAIIIDGFLSLLGVIFLALAIYGGFIWMKARGNEKEVERAKNILTDSIIGIVLVFAAYAIAKFVIGIVTK